MTNREPLILLIEDDDDHASLVRRCLNQVPIPHAFRHCPDAESGLDYLLHRDDATDEIDKPRPALVLLDLRLPRIDGLEVLRRIKQSEELCPVPVIVLSTSNARRDVAAAYASHANSYLVKPPELDDLAQMLQALCTYWLRWNRC